MFDSAIFPFQDSYRMQTFDGKSGIIFDSMNEEWKWNPSGEIGKDFIRTNVTDCQGKTGRIK